MTPSCIFSCRLPFSDGGFAWQPPSGCKSYHQRDLNPSCDLKSVLDNTEDFYSFYGIEKLSQEKATKIVKK